MNHTINKSFSGTPSIKARYSKGALQLLEKVDFPEGLDVIVHVEVAAPLSEIEKVNRFREAAGGWKNLLDCEQFLKEVYESRSVNTRPEVRL